MAVELYKHQKIAVDELKNGYILKGDVGSGKSITSLSYYYKNHKDKDLYIITTARKRDDKDWFNEMILFDTPTNLVVDSWNNIKKYADVKNAFFIFDEQRVVGYGTWVKNFIKIAKSNKWILLTATPGDIWMDYMPVFIANGFYKNKTDFVRTHVVYNQYSKYPKIDRYINTGRLNRLRKNITVNMKDQRHTKQNHIIQNVLHDEDKMYMILRKRWNPYEQKPVRDSAEAYRLMRYTANSHDSRKFATKHLIEKHGKVIIFYNFNYELEILKDICENELSIPYAQYNGHKHESIPETNRWVYLVQYTAGAEGWNCVLTDTIIFYSQNYSYKIMSQSAGRIDRLNTKFNDLYYYHLLSKSYIDKSIRRSVMNKKRFQEKDLYAN